MHLHIREKSCALKSEDLQHGEAEAEKICRDPASASSIARRNGVGVDDAPLKIGYENGSGIRFLVMQSL